MANQTENMANGQICQIRQCGQCIGNNDDIRFCPPVLFAGVKRNQNKIARNSCPETSPWFENTVGLL